MGERRCDGMDKLQSAEHVAYLTAPWRLKTDAEHAADDREAERVAAFWRCDPYDLIEWGRERRAWGIRP